MELTITLEEIVELHNEIVRISGGDYGVQNDSSLCFALDHIHYNNTKEEFFRNLALLFRSITQLHPFLDGNKRTGLMLIETLLLDNDLKLKLSDKEKEELVLDLAQGHYSIRKLENYLENNCE